MSDITWTLVSVTLDQLQPWDGNPKTSTAKNQAQLNDSAADLGQFQTIAVGPFDGNGRAPVYDGHQRLSAWKAKHGGTFAVQALQSSRLLTDQERRKIAIYSRQIGAWDWDVLSAWEPVELTAWGFDVDLLTDWRRDVAALGDFLESEETAQEESDAEPQTNRAEELREVWGVETGQLWRLPSRTPGQEHRIICGDCTDAAVVERVMGGERAELAPIDPPYNVGFDYDGETVDDNKAAELYEAFSRAWFGVCQSVSDKQIVTPGGVNHTFWDRLFDSKHCGVWMKTNALTRGRVSNSWCWEPVFFHGEKFGTKRSNDIFDYPISNQQGVANHPCPKPLKMWQDFIENYTEVGAIVFESFSGSGTTIIACENLARQCRAVEISPAYVAVALQRYQDAFGITPELIQ